MNHYPSSTFKAIKFAHIGQEQKILQLNQERGQLTGKVIPDAALLSMFKRYEPISIDEGFSQLTLVNMIGLIIESRIAV